MHASAELLDAIDTCLARQGQAGWAEAFVDLVAQTGAAQVMVFSYAPNAAACLLSRNFRARALGKTLGAEYLCGWYRHDPLFSVALEMAPGTLQRIDSSDIANAMPAEYRARFFERPGLSGKTTILAAGAALRLAVNFYRAGDAAPSVPGALETIMGRLALAHFEGQGAPAYPAPLEVLSERERAVCLGILSGRKAEAIAAELGVATSTIVTYRARAYHKLGISSRGSLFALCGK